MTEIARPDALEAPVQQDYFSFVKTDKYTFPDGLTYVEFKVMNEGDKKQYQQSTQSDVVLERRSGDARMKIDQAKQRHELIRTCVTGWNLARNGSLVPLTERSMSDFLKLANPEVVEGIESAIRKSNPWMLGEMTVEDIDEQIEDLKRQRERILEREQGESSSSSR